MNGFPSTMMEEELNLWDFLERAAARTVRLILLGKAPLNG